MSKRSGWDDNLSVTASGKGLVGHAGAVLLRKCGDRVGLTAALGGVLPAGHGLAGGTVAWYWSTWRSLSCSAAPACPTSHC